MATEKDVPIRFTHQSAVVVLPEGDYEGTRADSDHQLGTNGMSRKWLFVTITKAPEGAEAYIGCKINIHVG